MLATERHKWILGELRSKGTVQTSELAAQLDVSPMTIRRDLYDLAQARSLIKVHGGATSIDFSGEPKYEIKQLLNRAQKEAIASAAAELVHSGMTIAFSGGSTCTAVAERIRDVRDLTVVTNSLFVADQLYEGENGPSVILTGGQRTPTGALVGSVANATLSDLNVNTLFIGAHGAHLQRGLMTPNLNEAETNRGLIRTARRVVAVIDSSKWQLRGLSQFASWPEVDTVITDDGTPEELCDSLDALGVEVIVASTD
ncbi:DeoR/GlpR family DNA-binding transcription regulator [Corynebacterium uterequi]|uniref:Transcriptional regulator, DeoR family n=1 Tax=Corynebacterium uterequi TaxID=1072256 RepID=A0A0G3HCI7_9CORY|nr:DeoR/GlpR family DNA-binding transcription regulator [Corynebacterium uterequi]AKK11024.1 transcriptional regulator, DeoR family [Corynebacterium uterequi]